MAMPKTTESRCRDGSCRQDKLYQECIIRVSNSLYYCVALVQGHDLYNHIHGCGKPHGYEQVYVV